MKNISEEDRKRIEKDAKRYTKNFSSGYIRDQIIEGYIIGSEAEHANIGEMHKAEIAHLSETIREKEERIQELEGGLRKVRSEIFTDDSDADGSNVRESIYPDEIDFGTITTTIDRLLNQQTK